MSQTGGPIVQGRANFAVRLALAMPTLEPVDGNDVETARLSVTNPAGVSSEWTVTVVEKSSSEVTLRHVTDGATNAAAGEHWATASLYDADGELLYESPEFRVQVGSRRVGPLT